MRVPRAVNYTITALLILTILALLVGQLLGQPLLIFVETGSMEPTLEPGDGYVAIPQQFAGEINEGDVILFDAQELDGGGLTTHRVEAVTEEGYITKGDANPFTDQDGPEPIVAEGQVRSVAIQPFGDMIVLPSIGTGVLWMSDTGSAIADPIADTFGFDAPDGQLAGMIILAVGLVLLILTMITDTGEAVRSRVRARKGLLENVFVIAAILTLVVIIPLNISMLMPSGVYSFEIVSSSVPSETEGVIQAGTYEDVTYRMQNGGHLPMLVVLEPASAGVEIDDGYHQISPRSSEDIAVRMEAPEETGPHLRMVQEYRYMMVLPPSLIFALHEIHPFVAVGAINLVVISLVMLLTIGAVGTDRDRSRARPSRNSLFDNLLR